MLLPLLAVATSTLQPASLSGAEQALPPIEEWQIEGIRAGLHDANPGVRERAAETMATLLQSHTPDNRLTTDLLDLLKDRSFYVRYAAVMALAKLDCHDVIPLLVKLLEDEDPYVRGTAARELGRLKATDAVPQLLKMIQESYQPFVPQAPPPRPRPPRQPIDDTYDLRRETEWKRTRVDPVHPVSLFNEGSEAVEAVDALGQLGDTKVVPELRKLLQDQRAEVCGAAAKALGRLNAQIALPELRKMLLDGSVFSEVAEALIRLNPRRAESDFRELLWGQSSDLPYICASTVALLSSPQAHGHLLAASALYPGRTHNFVFRLTAAVVLAQLTGEESMAFLDEVLKDEDLDIRQAITALGQLEPKKAVPRLRKLVAAFPWAARPLPQPLELQPVPQPLWPLDTNPQKQGDLDDLVFIEGVKTLVRLNPNEGQEAIPQLRKLLQHKNERIFIEAVKVLVRVNRKDAQEAVPRLRKLLAAVSGGARPVPRPPKLPLDVDVLSLLAKPLQPPPPFLQDDMGDLAFIETVEVLVRVNPKDAQEAVPRLRELLQHPRMHHEAAVTLGRLDDSEAVPHLLMSLEANSMSGDANEVCERLRSPSTVAAALNLAYVDTSAIPKARWLAHYWGGGNTAAEVLCTYLAKPRIPGPVPETIDGVKQVIAALEQVLQDNATPLVQQDAAAVLARLLLGHESSWTAADEIELRRYAGILEAHGLQVEAAAVRQIVGRFETYRRNLVAGAIVSGLTILLVLVLTIMLSQRVRWWLLVRAGRRWMFEPGHCEHKVVVNVLPGDARLRLAVDAGGEGFSIEDNGVWPPDSPMFSELRRRVCGKSVRVETVESQFRKPWANAIGGPLRDGTSAAIAGQICLVDELLDIARAPLKRIVFAGLGCEEVQYCGDPATSAKLPSLKLDPEDLEWASAWFRFQQKIGCLPDPTGEIDLITERFRLWGASILPLPPEAKAAADIEHLQEALREADIVHVAAHASPAGVYLQNRLMNAGDLSRLLDHVRCRILILSACDLGDLRHEASFVFPLVRRGVNVLAATKPLRGRACVTFFSAFYAALLPRRRATGIWLASAMQQAAIACFPLGSSDTRNTLWTEGINSLILYGDPSLHMQL
jgi:HEAT repeat protein